MQRVRKLYCGIFIGLLTATIACEQPTLGLTRTDRRLRVVTNPHAEPLRVSHSEALPALLEFEQRIDDFSPYPSPRNKNEIRFHYPIHVQILSALTALLKNENSQRVQTIGDTYDKANRDQIIEIARDFLRNTPVDGLRAEAGMTLEPYR